MDFENFDCWRFVKQQPGPVQVETRKKQCHWPTAPMADRSSQIFNVDATHSGFRFLLGS